MLYVLEPFRFYTIASKTIVAPLRTFEIHLNYFAEWADGTYHTRETHWITLASNNKDSKLAIPTTAIRLLALYTIKGTIRFSNSFPFSRIMGNLFACLQFCWSLLLVSQKNNRNGWSEVWTEICWIECIPWARCNDAMPCNMLIAQLMMRVSVTKLVFVREPVRVLRTFFCRSFHTKNNQTHLKWVKIPPQQIPENAISSYLRFVKIKICKSHI